MTMDVFRCCSTSYTFLSAGRLEFGRRRTRLLPSLGRVSVNIRALEQNDGDEIAALSLTAWALVHESMAAVLGPELNARIYPDWAARREIDVRTACGDEQMLVSVVEQNGRVVGFVAVLPRTREPGTSEIDAVAVDPAVQGGGVGRALTNHALAQLRAAGCSLAVVAPRR